eukprot:scaffold61910_cov21-Tisochrysis_lutea.AAC.1
MTRPHLTEGCGGCLKLRPLQDGDRGGGAAAWRPQQYSWPGVSFQYWNIEYLTSSTPFTL